MPAGISAQSLTNQVAALLNGSQQINTGTPDDVAQSMDEQGMNTLAFFGPGRPLEPYFEVGTPARRYNYMPGYNLVTRPRSVVSQMSFDTIRQIYRVYDIGRMCIEHRIDEISNLEWSIVAGKGITDDVSDEIAIAEKMMERPDGTTPFQSWQSSFLEDVLRFDAGALFVGRLRSGAPAALEVVDGTTIIPLIGQRGRRPKAPAPAFTQVIQGLPGVWMTDRDMYYQPLRQQNNSMYGLCPMEWLILNANTDLRFQRHFLAYFTEGTLPAGFMEAPEDFTDPDQIAILQATWDSVMEGDAGKKRQVRWVPAGSKFTPYHDEPFSSDFSEWMLKKTCAGHKVKPTALGFVDDVNRAQGDVQQDVAAQIGRGPLMKYLRSVYTWWLRDVQGLRVKFEFEDGGEKEDLLQQAQADQIYIEKGVISSDEPRARLGYKVDTANPVPRTMTTRTGLVPLSSIMALGGKNLDPETLAPRAGTVAFVEDEPQPAALSGQEQPVTDIVGGRQIATPAPGGGTGAPSTTPSGAPTGSATPSPPAATAKPPEATGRPPAWSPGEATGPVVKELNAFARFAKSRAERGGGAWRDFQFTEAAPFIAGLLNEAGKSDPATAATLAQSMAR
jgi:hypothetical protein